MFKNKSAEYIKNYIKDLTEEEFFKIQKELEKDSRKIVKNILEKKIKEITKINKEKARVSNMILFDKSFNRNIIIGVDEVGRGPLAGPVVAASVIMDTNKPILYIDDSKKISRQKREQLYNKIIENSIFCSISEVDNKFIDKYNILNATFTAMNSSINFIKKEISQKNENIDLILVDGNHKIKNQPINQECIIKGDSKSYSIACASILAKVHRDRLMDKLHYQYPMYNFLSNSGYGTTEHILAIKKYGLSKVHRETFCKNLLD